MVSFSFMSVTADTSAAETSIRRVDGERAVVAGAIEAFIQAWAGRKGFTEATAQRLNENIQEMLQKLYGDMAKAREASVKLESDVKVSTHRVISHSMMMLSQAWNIVERIAGDSKNVAVRIVSLTISSISSVIAMGYASAATMATMGPAGVAMAAMQIGSTLTSVAAQANAVANQAAIENAVITTGKITFGEDF
jgi:CDP-diacylglycerol pyrophosphatase